MAKQTQTVIVSKSVAKSLRSAKAIARSITGRKPPTSRKTKGSYRFAQFPKAQCVRGTHRTKRIRPGVSIVICTRRRRGR